MPAAGPVDVLIVSLGSTPGLRAADAQLHASLQAAGAKVALARALAPRQTRTLMLTDLGWALAARTAANATLGRLGSAPRALLYSTTTAALLWQAPGAIRFDALSAANRAGRHGLWQRPLERRRLAEAPLLLPWSEGALAEVPEGTIERQRALVLPVSVEPSGPPEPVRDIAALTYAANPSKKGLDRVLAAWRELLAQGGLFGGGPDGATELVIAGSSPDELRRAGLLAGPEPGVRVLGRLEAPDYRALVRRARVFVCAPRREDYGIAQLEALADGCQLVTTPAPGPYAALPIARALDGRLVGERLVDGLRAALSDPLPGYGERARELLAPFSPRALEALIAGELLPRLLA